MDIAILNFDSHGWANEMTTFLPNMRRPEFGTHAETIGSTNKSSKRYWIRYLLVKSS